MDTGMEYESCDPYDYGYTEDEPDHEPTKQERREAHRQRDRMGMVKHLAPDVRPAKMPKSRVRFK